MYPFWFFFDAIDSMAEEKKLDRNDPLKLVIKLQWASFFLESSIMIYDRMNKKRKKLIGALFDKLWLTKASLILHVVRYDGWICCLLRQPIKLQWASIFLKSSIMINDRINKKRMKLIGALFDKFSYFEKLTGNIISCGGWDDVVFFLLLLFLLNDLYCDVRTYDLHLDCEPKDWLTRSNHIRT